MEQVAKHEGKHVSTDHEAQQIISCTQEQLILALSVSIPEPQRSESDTLWP